VAKLNFSRSHYRRNIELRKFHQTATFFTVDVSATFRQNISNKKN